MYHQFTFSGPTINGIEYPTNGIETKKPRNELTYIPPSGMNNIPIDILRLLGDYLDTRALIQLLMVSKFNQNIPPYYFPRMHYIDHFKQYPDRFPREKRVKMLDDAVFRQHLTINTSQAEPVINMLKDDTTIKSLTINDDDVGVDDIEDLCNMLKVNKTLTEIDLQHNNIGAEGTKAIADALKENDTLTTINLENNYIYSRGAKAIADALIENKKLTTINLKTNYSGDDGAKHLIEALKKNTSLTTINLKTNKIGTEGKEALKESNIHNINLLF